MCQASGVRVSLGQLFSILQERLQRFIESDSHVEAVIANGVDSVERRLSQTSLLLVNEALVLRVNVVA